MLRIYRGVRSEKARLCLKHMFMKSNDKQQNFVILFEELWSYFKWWIDASEALWGYDVLIIWLHQKYKAIVGKSVLTAGKFLNI